MPRTENIPPASEAHLTYDGGMIPFSFAPNVYHKGINVHHSDGRFLKPRPGWRHIPLEYDSEETRDAFENGKWQGESYYGYSNNAVIVYAIDGQLFIFNPLDKTVKKAEPTSGEAPFSRFADFIYFTERSGGLIAQDGINRAVIFEGLSPRTADPDAFEVPVGTIMADCGGWLFDSNIERNGFRASDHEMDPNSTPLKFTQGFQHYLGSPLIRGSRRYGRITAMRCLPDKGFLTVFFERNTVVYNFPPERLTWPTTNSVVQELAHGAAGHHALTAYKTNIAFIDGDGALWTLAYSASESESGRLTTLKLDRPVEEWTSRAEAPAWRRNIHLVHWGGRLLRTVRPEGYTVGTGADVRRGVRWRGLVSFDADDHGNWEGLETGPAVVGISHGPFAGDGGTTGEDRLFAFCRDDDGVNRIYERRRDLRHDVTPDGVRSIRWTVYGREFFAGDWHLRKRLQHGSVHLKNIRGPLTLSAYYQIDDRADRFKWFTHADGAGECLSLADGLPVRDPACIPCHPPAPASATACAYRQAAGQARTLTTPSDPEEEPPCDPATGRRSESFYAFRPVWAFEGYAELGSYKITLIADTTPDTPDTSCGDSSKNTPCPVLYACAPDDFDYSFANSNQKKVCDDPF